MEISISKEDILRSAERYLVEHPIKPVAADTAAQYRREFERIAKNSSVAETIEKLCHTRKKATFFKRKYALRHELSRRIAQLVKDIDTMPAPPDQPSPLEKLVWLLELGAGIDGLGSSCPIPKEQQQPRRSKRRDIGGLPKDWREQLLDGMIHSKNYVPALLASVSGCRPSELRKGVSLRIEGGMLRIEVAGAKVAAGKGQPRRIIEYGISGAPALVADLATLVELAGGELEVFINSTKAFSSAIAYYGHRGRFQV